MISVANLLVHAYHLRLGHDCIDKLIFLRMNIRFIERVRRKEALTFILIQDVLSDKHASYNEE